MRHLVQQHTALQAAASSFAVARPGVIQLLDTLLNGNKEDRSEAFSIWRCRAQSHRAQLRRQAQLREWLETRSKYRAVEAMDVFRARASARAARKAPSSRLHGLSKIEN